MPYSLPDEIAARVRRLHPAQQAQALAFVRQLETTGASPGASAALAEFAGTIPAEDLATIAAVIEADCERVDAAGW
jgi:hypothetical protein